MTNIKLHNYERKENDKYLTIEADRLVPVLLNNFDIGGRTLEPTGGRGHMIDALRANGVDDIAAFDIDPGRDDIKQCAIEDLTPDATVDSVITNLPFKNQDEHIMKLLETFPQARHAYLVKADFHHAMERCETIHNNPRFAGYVHVVIRPRWFENEVIAPGEKKKSPAVNYNWLLYREENAAETGKIIAFEDISERYAAKVARREEKARLAEEKRLRAIERARKREEKERLKAERAIERARKAEERALRAEEKERLKAERAAERARKAEEKASARGQKMRPARPGKEIQLELVPLQENAGSV